MCFANVQKRYENYHIDTDKRSNRKRQFRPLGLFALAAMQELRLSEFECFGFVGGKNGVVSSNQIAITKVPVKLLNFVCLSTNVLVASTWASFLLIYDAYIIFTFFAVVWCKFVENVINTTQIEGITQLSTVVFTCYTEIWIFSVQKHTVSKRKTLARFIECYCDFCFYIWFASERALLRRWRMQHSHPCSVSIHAMQSIKAHFLHSHWCRYLLMHVRKERLLQTQSKQQVYLCERMF